MNRAELDAIRARLDDATTGRLQLETAMRIRDDAYDLLAALDEEEKQAQGYAEYGSEQFRRAEILETKHDAAIAERDDNARLAALYAEKTRNSSGGPKY